MRLWALCILLRRALGGPSLSLLLLGNPTSEYLFQVFDGSEFLLLLELVPVQILAVDDRQVDGSCIPLSPSFVLLDLVDGRVEEGLQRYFRDANSLPVQAILDVQLIVIFDLLSALKNLPFYTFNAVLILCSGFLFLNFELLKFLPYFLLFLC